MSPLSLKVLGDPDAVAHSGAVRIAERARAATGQGWRFSFAVSGGHTPWAMLTRLANEDLPWTEIDIFQVDERVAPDGDPDRNLTHLVASLGDVGARVYPMPVTDPDLAQAATRYEAVLPGRLDLVHLGLGADGHTASLVPEDPVLDLVDRDVGLTRPYQGRTRMTLTYPALARASELLWVVTGADKAQALARMLRGDRGIPAGRVDAERALVLADAPAAREIDPNRISDNRA